MSGPQQKAIKSVIRLGKMDFQYALQKRCFKCDECILWVRSLSEVEEAMICVKSEKKARKRIEWETEEASGDENFDSFA